MLLFSYRWMAPDKLSEKYYDINPYVYCAGNPVNLVDNCGDSLTIVHRKGFLGLGGEESLICENAILPKTAITGSKISKNNPKTIVVANERENFNEFSNLFTAGSKKYATAIPTTNGNKTERSAYNKIPHIKKTAKINITR